MKTGVFITTFNRGKMLAETLKTVVPAANEVGAQVLVVNDGGDKADCDFYAGIGDAVYRSYDPSPVTLHLPQNRGLACAMNVGLAWFLADPSIEAISYFQDDVEVDPLCIAACNVALERCVSVVTGHDAKEHMEKGDWGYGTFNGVNVRGRNSCRATHMAATVESWKRVLPIPSRGLGLPGTRIMDGKRGTGSGVDWWVVRDSPNRLPVLCIPGLVRSFAHKAEDSTWKNESIGGEEPALSRDAISGWIEGRKK